MQILFKLLLISLLFNTLLFSLETTIKIQENNTTHSIKIIKNEKINDEEKIFWELVQRKNTKKDYQYYLKNYPNGNYQKLAIYNIKIFKDKLITYSLTVKREPSDSKVVIINNTENYTQNMQLQLGRYKIKVSKKGYEPKFKSIYLNKNTVVFIKLRKVNSL